jgi:hypothetical protein
MSLFGDKQYIAVKKAGDGLVSIWFFRQDLPDVARSFDPASRMNWMI